jgi:uncharacterized protein YlxP (DUF503 family)
MHTAALELDLHLPACRSLKAKRSVVKPIVEGLRHRFSVAAAEVDHQDQWQRTVIGVAVVASTPSHVVEVLDEVERFVWSRPDIEVLETTRRWLE